MQKLILILVIVGIVGIGGVLFSSRNTPQTSVEPDEVLQPSESPLTQSDQRYVAYSQEVFDAARDKKRVLYFHAPWCPTCVPTDKEFAANVNKIPTDVVLFKTDYDTSTELKKKYGITYQHTFVLVDQNGGEITKWNGGAVAELIENTK